MTIKHVLKITKATHAQDQERRDDIYQQQLGKTKIFPQITVQIFMDGCAGQRSLFPRRFIVDGELQL
jgi:hypothetical protein